MIFTSWKLSLIQDLLNLNVQRQVLTQMPVNNAEHLPLETSFNGADCRHSTGTSTFKQSQLHVLTTDANNAHHAHQPASPPKIAHAQKSIQTYVLVLAFGKHNLLATDSIKEDVSVLFYGCEDWNMCEKYVVSVWVNSASRPEF